MAKWLTILSGRNLIGSLLFFSPLLLAGCATITATNPSHRNLTSAKHYYVVLQPDTSISHTVETDLVARGFNVAGGPENTVTPDADVVVTFDYRWFWDLTPYLKDFSVVLRDPHTREFIADGLSTHDSFSRRPQEVMVHETFDKVFATGK